MEISFLLDNDRWSEDGRPDWKVRSGWSGATCVPRKGELVMVASAAEEADGIGSAEPGSLIEREMRVIEVCYMGPQHVRIYLVPTYVRVAPS